ncbi:MAG: peptidoglycan-binding protein, partial [Firmicutes bacterium]|nr:peptidoglycan-binding protein [Bacillota bacterium]
MGIGYLIVKVSTADTAVPIEGATVVVKDASGRVWGAQRTDASGSTERVPLPAPDRIHSFNPNYSGSYYATYDVEVSAPRFDTNVYDGVQVFDTVESVQQANMQPSLPFGPPQIHIYHIPPHEQVLKTPRNQSAPPEPAPGADPPSDADPPPGSVVPRVIIPDYITVHLGRYNVAARNIRVPFPDYIKNVASSEIFPDWPPASLEANIRAIINFALNRVYTEWYPSRGYPFDITNSTTTDQYFVEGRNYFSTIIPIVDRIMGEYLRRPNHFEPFFTEFCNGTTATCPGMSQWGTVTLANRGLSALQILRYYYPNDLFIDTAPVGSITESFPGIPLVVGTRGSDVELMQRYLNRIRRNYPLIPAIANPNGVFGADTQSAVRTFQNIFSLPQTGVIDRATWNKISYMFVAVAKLAELTSEGDQIVVGHIPPNVVIQQGASGGLVTRLQFLLTYIAQVYPEIPEVARSGSFGPSTRNAVIAFQNRFGLTPDGVVGPATWKMLYDVYDSVKGTVPPPGAPTVPPPSVGPAFPGTSLRVGSAGESVRLMQQYLNALAAKFTSIP